jgi:hypothetical protein
MVPRQVLVMILFVGDFNSPAMPCKVGGSKLDAYKKQVDRRLEGDKRERNKQWHTATRIFNWLVDEQCHSDGPY